MRWATALLIFALTSCSAQHVAGIVPAAQDLASFAKPHGIVGGKIAHIVIVTMENRTFDNLFNGFPGADTAQVGRIHDGTIVPLRPEPLYQPYDLDHSHPAWLVAFDGAKMDGFDRLKILQGFGHGPPPPDYPYAYTQRSDVKPYWDMAAQYTLGDEMFQSNTGPSFAAHQFLIAAQSEPVDNPTKFPWGCFSPPGTTAPITGPNGKEIYPGPFPCYNYETLGDLLDMKGISWHYYTQRATGAYNGYGAIRHISFGPDWTKDILTGKTHFFDDVKSGNLAQVNWIVPTYIQSDHAGGQGDTGPAWLASVVNAVGSSSYWNSTAIIVVWDDWGGWYDHVAPQQINHWMLGFRVPLLVISPWAKHGYVSHVKHQFGSIIRFVEEDFSLPTLGVSDARSDDLTDCFSVSPLGSPLPFRPFSTGLSQSQVLDTPYQDADDDF